MRGAEASLDGITWYGAAVRVEDVVAAALDGVRRAPDVSYADARAVLAERETLTLRIEEAGGAPRLGAGGAERSEGISVRVLVGGAWGFAARPGITAASAAAAAADALAVARAGRSIAPPTLARTREEPGVGTWATPVVEDPFAVPIARKLADLGRPLAILGADLGGGARLLTAEARMLWRRDTSTFASTEGARTHQVRVAGGAGIKLIVEGHGRVVTRTWPMDLDGGVLGRGYEGVATLDLDVHAPRIRDEALALLTAPPCPAGRSTLILDTPQLALQIHESCGHPCEGDRALGEELSLAGGSFLAPDKLGKLTYGSRHVNLVADARVPGAVGTFGWDDEGVAARRTALISRGRFVGYLTGRDVAGRLGVPRSAGCMRAEHHARPPIIRMTNVSLDPDPQGAPSLDALIADTTDGILMTTNRSWSIDDLRLNFRFGCEAAWKIERGKRTQLLYAPFYTGRTPTFWAGCDAIAAPSAFQTWGFVSCGKGDPIQLMAVGHGCAPARFRDVEVGSSA